MLKEGWRIYVADDKPLRTNLRIGSVARTRIVLVPDRRAPIGANGGSVVTGKFLRPCVGGQELQSVTETFGQLASSALYQDAPSESICLQLEMLKPGIGTRRGKLARVLSVWPRMGFDALASSA